MLLRVREVCKLTGLSKSSLYRRMHAGSFPAPLLLGGPGSRCSGWKVEDVDEWIESLQRKQWGEGA